VDLRGKRDVGVAKTGTPDRLSTPRTIVVVLVSKYSDLHGAVYIYNNLREI
jgi:hypothetical protein